MKRIFYSLAFLLLAVGASAQYISITSQSAIYSEDFNTLGTSGTNLSTLPGGWWINESTTAASTIVNFQYNAGDGSLNSGNTYSYGTGTASDRALGSVASGSNASNFGVRYINNSGSAFSSFYIRLNMEQWRTGGARTAPDTLYLFYAVNGNNDSLGFVKITTGNWTRYAAGDMVSLILGATGIALDGNAGANRLNYSLQVTGVSVNAGDTLYLRWRDPNAVGNDDGLAIDDYAFSVLTAAPLPVKYLSFTATKQGLKWSTASESNNSHFEVQRSIDGKSFESIARVKGNGTSNKVNNYSYVDGSAPAVKTVYYRLKQMDMDGKFEYSKTVSVIVAQNASGIQTTLPNPFANELSIGLTTTTSGVAQIELMDMIGKLHHSSTEMMAAGANTIEINTTNVPDGIYFVRVSVNGETFTRKVVKK